jgi:hypothetical protein
MTPETAQWLTPDPPVKAPDPKFMAEPWGLHPYQYVKQNPIAYWDPDGRDIDWAEVVSSIACGIFGGCGVAHAPRPDKRGQPRLTADKPDGYVEGALYAAGGAAIGKVGKWAVGRVLGWAFGKAAGETAEATTKGLAKVTDEVADDAIRMGDDLADDASRIVDDVADDAAGGIGGADDFVNLASPTRTKHILTGDGPGSGGHLWPGQPGKNPFPQGWSGDRIMHHVSDIATDPSLTWVQQTGKAGSLFTKAGDPARFFVIGEREGVRIKVILEPAGEGIITAFPL